MAKTASSVADSAVVLAGRTFASVAGTAAPPRGSYVAHGALYYAVRRGQYPLRVLADMAADQPGQLVLAPARGNAFIGMLAGTDRAILLNRDEHNPEDFFRAVLRLSLSSSTREIVSLGPVDGVPTTEKSISNLILPATINPSRTWKIAGMLGLAVVLAGASGVYARLVLDRGTEAARAELVSATASFEQLLSEVRLGRKSPEENAAKLLSEAGLVNLSPPVPVNEYLFSEQLESVLPGATLIVEHGRLKA